MAQAGPTFWQRRSTQERLWKALAVLFLCGLGAIFIAPFLWSLIRKSTPNSIQFP